MTSEEALVAQVIAGNPDAEAEFFNLYRPRLYRAALYFLGTQDSEADDIVQDTFMIALPKLKDYVFRAPIYAWLRRICLNQCYSRIRSRKRMLASLEEDLELFMRKLAAERIQNEGLELEKQQKLALLHELKKQLNPDSREIIEMRNVQGLSYAAIALALKIPIGTVMSRLARARDQVRKLVEDSSPTEVQAPPEEQRTPVKPPKETA